MCTGPNCAHGRGAQATELVGTERSPTGANVRGREPRGRRAGDPGATRSRGRNGGVSTLSKVGLVLIAAGLSWMAGVGADWPGLALMGVGVILAFGPDLLTIIASRRRRRRDLAEGVVGWEAGFQHVKDISKLILTLTPPPSSQVDSSVGCEVELPDGDVAEAAQFVAEYPDPRMESTIISPENGEVGRDLERLLLRRVPRLIPHPGRNRSARPAVSRSVHRDLVSRSRFWPPDASAVHVRYRPPRHVLAGVTRTMNLEDLEQGLRDALALYSPAMRAEPLYILTLPDYDRAGHIGELYRFPATRSIAELAIDAEEDRYLRAVLVRMLREV